MYLPITPSLVLQNYYLLGDTQSRSFSLPFAYGANLRPHPQICGNSLRGGPAKVIQ